MEEAWEFAVVINSLNGPSVYVGSNYQEPILVENSEWSGRHVRLKYQMMISSVFLYLMTATSVQGLNLFGFLVYGEEFPKQTIFYMALAFSVFAIISFFLRTVFEAIRWSSLRRDMMNLVKEIKVCENSLLENFDFKTDFSFSKKVLSKIEEPNDEFGHDFLRDFDELRQSQREGNIRDLSAFTSKIGNCVSRLRSGLEHLRPGSHPDMTDYEVSFSQVSRAVSGITNSIEYAERDISQFDRAVSSSFSTIRRNIENYSSSLKELNESLPYLPPKSSVLMRTERSRRRIYFLQNYGLSVIIPAFVAVFLVLSSIVIKFGGSF